MTFKDSYDWPQPSRLLTAAVDTATLVELNAFLKSRTTYVDKGAEKFFSHLI